MTNPWQENSLFRKTKQVHWKSVDGEAVLLSFASGDYFALDQVGTSLWAEICESPKRMQDLINNVVAEYDCSTEQAYSDVKEFCGQLLAEKLIEIV